MTQNHTILLVSDDAALCAAARQELESLEEGLRVAAVSTVEAAHGIVADATPAVILLEETPVEAESREHPGQGARLELAVSALAGYAPVVVIGQTSHQSSLAPLVTAGLADFVVRCGQLFTRGAGLGGATPAAGTQCFANRAANCVAGKHHGRCLWRGAAA